MTTSSSLRTLPAVLGAVVLGALTLGAGACGSSGGARTAGTVALDSTATFVQGGRTLARATFATGCFWCTEADFDKVPGVVSTTSGYTGGAEQAPTYEQVSGHRTGHVEAVQIVYDPARVSYGRLLDHFWHTTDPTDASGQFCDRGSPYRSAIFTHSDAQRRAADSSKAAIEASGVLGAPIVTAIRPAAAFWAAEGYHQDFHTKENVRYETYRLGCRRDARLRDLWGDAAR